MREFGLGDLLNDQVVSLLDALNLKAEVILCIRYFLYAKILLLD